MTKWLGAELSICLQKVAQVFNLCEGFSHSLERLCHQSEKPALAAAAAALWQQYRNLVNPQDCNFASDSVYIAAIGIQ